MIKTVQNKALAALLDMIRADINRTPKGLPVQNVKRVRAMLAAMDAADSLAALNLPGYFLHELIPGFPGLFSIRVTGNWRIVFRWDDGPTDVDIVDYH